MFKKNNYINAQLINGKVYIEANLDDNLELDSILNLVNAIQNEDILLNCLSNKIKSTEKVEQLKKIMKPQIQEPVKIQRFRNPAIKPEDVIKSFVSHLKGEI